MKNIYITFILIVPFLEGFTQSLNFERSIQYDYSTWMFNVLADPTDKSFIVTGGYDLSSSIFYSPPFITKIDSLGNTVWTHQSYISASEVNNIGNLVRCFDSNFVYSGYEQTTCDVGGGVGYIRKITPAGNTVFTKIIDSGNDGFASGMVCLSNGSFRISNFNSVYHFDSNGDSLEMVNYSYGRILQIELTPDNYLLLGCDSAIIKTDTSGTILHVIPAVSPKNVKASDVDEYYFSSGVTIYKTDSMLNVTHQLNLQNFASSIQNITPKQSQVWAIVQKTSPNSSVLVKYSDTLTFIDSVVYSNYNGSNFFVSSIAENGGNHFLAGYEFTQFSHHGFIKGFNSSCDSTNFAGNDVGIVSSRVDTSYATSDGLFGYYLTFSAFTTIKNYGSTVLNNVCVNSRFGFGLYCMAQAFYRNYTGLSILPGDSMEVYLGMLTYLNFGFTPFNNNVQLCFYTSSPNIGMDINHINDNYCKTFQVTNITSVEEHESRNDIKVLPNPFTSKLQVDINNLNCNFFTVRISNLLGQTLYQESAKKDLGKDSYVLDLAFFEDGIYILEIITPTQTISGKIIKQNH